MTKILVIVKGFESAISYNVYCSKKRIGNRNLHSRLPIADYQINSISLIESEEFRETSIVNVADLLQTCGGHY